MKHEYENSRVHLADCMDVMRGNIDFTACELDNDYFNDGNARFMDFVKKYEPADKQPVTATGQNKLF